MYFGELQFGLSKVEPTFYSVDSFHVIVPFLYPLKRSEIRSFCDALQFLDAIFYLQFLDAIF